MIAVTYFAGWLYAHWLPILVFAVLPLAAIGWVAVCCLQGGGRHVAARDAADAATEQWITDLREQTIEREPTRSQPPPGLFTELAHEEYHAAPLALTNVPGRDGKRPDSPAVSLDASGSQHHATAHATVMAGPGHPAGDLPPPEPEPWPRRGKPLDGKVIPPADDSAILWPVGERGIAQLASERPRFGPDDNTGTFMLAITAGPEAEGAPDPAGPGVFSASLDWHHDMAGRDQ